MDVFDAISLLVAIGLLATAFLRRPTADPSAFHKTLAYWMAALILYYPVSALFTVGVFLCFVARPVGFVLMLVSFRLLCLALFTARGLGDEK